MAAFSPVKNVRVVPVVFRSVLSKVSGAFREANREEFHLFDPLTRSPARLRLFEAKESIREANVDLVRYCKIG